jgi:RHS repeat-associated protein
MYVIGHQRISQIVIKNGTEQEYYFTFDGHGSTRVLLDITAAILQLYSFDAYGNAIGFIPAEVLTEFLYSGEQFDSKIGQQYLRARYYDPATGRFNRLDPFFGNLNDPQSLHKYLYTHADPVNGIDPSGEFIGVAIGGLGMLGAMAIGSHFYTSKSRTDITTGATIITKLQYMAKLFNVAIAAHISTQGISMFYYMFGSGGERSESGRGGLDVTWYLSAIQQDVKEQWNKLSKENKKRMFDILYSFNPFSDVMIIRGWDIDDFYKHKKGKFAGPKSLGFCPNTVTISGEVYYAEEVNYFLWGLINRLAYDDGIRTIDTNRFCTIYIVFQYRTVLYPFTAGSGATLGRMAWTTAGWDAGADGTIIYPDYIALPNATPNDILYTDFMTYNVGDAPMGLGVQGNVKY